jgi:ribosomal protein L34
VNYRRVLNRAARSPLPASRLLLRLLIETFAPNGPVVPGLDDTIARRRGKRVAAKGIHRDPVRSSHGHFVKASGLRRLGVMLPVPIPRAQRIRAQRIRALPFPTALAPSERHNREHGRRHKKLTGWGRQVVLQARRRLPGRDLVLVADSSFAALDFPAALVGRSGRPRCRLHRRLHHPPAPRCRPP